MVEVPPGLLSVWNLTEDADVHRVTLPYAYRAGSWISSGAFFHPIPTQCWFLPVQLCCIGCLPWFYCFYCQRKVWTGLFEPIDVLEVVVHSVPCAVYSPFYLWGDFSRRTHFSTTLLWPRPGCRCIGVLASSLLDSCRSSVFGSWGVVTVGVVDSSLSVLFSMLSSFARGY